MLKVNKELLQNNFENWCKGRGLDTSKREGWGDAEYYHDHIESMWIGYQAHAQSIVEVITT